MPAESETNFQVWKADATARHTLAHKPPFENLPSSFFFPLTTRRGSQRRARVSQFFFAPLSTWDHPQFSKFRAPLIPDRCLRSGLQISPFIRDLFLSFLSRMSENTSSIATSRPTRSTRATVAAASSNKTTTTTDPKQRGGPSVKKSGAGAKKKGKGKEKEQVYCICREKDYGTPMMCCGACREW